MIIAVLKKCALLILVFFIVSCRGPETSPSSDELTQSKEQIEHMAKLIEADISKNGPTAWLNYFEDCQNFFMASNGTLVFKNYQTAHQFISTTLVKTISEINLKWSNINVNLYTNNWGSLGAGFHEDLIDTSGKTISINGYFTATTHKTVNGWKLRNVHWSIKPAA